MLDSERLVSGFTEWEVTAFCRSVTFSSLKINICTVEYDGELCTRSPFNFARLMRTLCCQRRFSLTFRTRNTKTEAPEVSTAL